MDAFILDDGIFTACLPTAAAFLMRTSMSAIGSVMLMIVYLASISGKDCVWLPGCLAQPRHVAAHGRFAQLVPAQAELGVHRARTAGQRTAGGLARRGRVARQLLQPGRGLHLLVVVRRLTGDDLLQLLALGGVLLRQPDPLDIAVDHGFLCHIGSLPQRNGKRKASSRALASSSVFAVVVMAISMPRTASTWSKSSSGKMICSFPPMLRFPRPSNDRAGTPRKSRTRGSDTFTSRSKN